MRAKAAGRLAGLSWLVVAFVIANTTAPLAVTPAGASDAREANAKALSATAQTLAQAYLDRFYGFALSSAALGSAQARVQVTSNGDTFWAVPVAVTPQGYSASLLADGAAGSVGEIVEFRKENVRDWTFKGHNRRVFGAFQMRAELSLLSRERAAQQGHMLSASPVPAGW
jgi:uncharacterized protein YegJ (DUF2314 family)